MPEDKLTHAERLRLEALSQSIHLTMALNRAPPQLDSTQAEKFILERAERIEEWLTAANKPMH